MSFTLDDPGPVHMLAAMHGPIVTTTCGVNEDRETVRFTGWACDVTCDECAETPGVHRAS